MNSQRARSLQNTRLFGASVVVCSCLCFGTAFTAAAQTMVTTMTLGRDEIGLVKTSQGITTKISFPEKIREIICGDLYDPASGKGNFVIQKSDNDIFLKPVAPTGVSNLFVKTGENAEYTYSFELIVLQPSQSFRIVNIANGHLGKKTHALITPPVVAKFDSRAGMAVDLSSIALVSVIPTVDPMIVAPPPVPVKADSHQQPTPMSRSIVPVKEKIERVELQPEPIRREKPVYPEVARQAGVFGEVVVEVTVNDRGRVLKAKALSGHILLRQAAETAARSWKFRPITNREGGPVQSVSTITFVFHQPVSSTQK
jgi:TonB family protein